MSTTIILTLTAEQAMSGEGLAQTGHGATIPVRDALTWTGDGRIFPVVCGGQNGNAAPESGVDPPPSAVFAATRPITAYGTSHRIFTEGQRLAMIARDKGCSFTGCTIAPMWCEAHHVTDWVRSKRTSVDDGALVCGYHHREFERLGWRATILDGIPHWIAPLWIDPDQVPRRNTAHDPLRTG